MRQLSALLAGILALGWNASAADRLRPFIVHLPDTILSESCDVRYEVRGGFGVFRSTTEPDSRSPHTISILTTTWEGQEASFRAIIACKGRRFALIDVPSLKDSTYETSIAPAPVNWLPVAGRLLATTEGRILAGFPMRVHLVAAWTCNFFGLADCFVPWYEITQTTIGPDGSFSLSVPDVLTDPAIQQYGGKRNGFIMMIEEPIPPRQRYLINDTGWLLPAAASYPTPLVVQPVPFGPKSKFRRRAKLGRLAVALAQAVEVKPGPTLS